MSTIKMSPPRAAPTMIGTRLLTARSSLHSTTATQQQLAMHNKLKLIHLISWLVVVDWEITTPFSMKIGYIGDKVLDRDLVLPG